MASASRSSRSTTRKSHGRFASKQQTATKPSHRTSYSTTRTSSFSSSFMNNDTSQPPNKKRRLDLRFKQSTLDTHFLSRPPPPPVGQDAQSQLPKPPAKLSIEQPHGKVLETINGVRKELDIEVDELALSATPSRKNTPRPAQQAVSTAQANGTRSARGTATPQPGTAAGSRPDDKRSLRSRDDGPRLKSELATYFPNYEEIVFDVPKEKEFINTESTFYVTDGSSNKQLASPSRSSNKTPRHRKASTNGLEGVSPTTSAGFNGCASLDLSFASRSLPENDEDPLSDDHFSKAHRKAERREKQLRNIEKERAMHEKVQLDRLLEGLLGHDWLRVMGISGVTETEAKKYEPKRDYFIADVQALVDKFRSWKEEEKRQRLEREEARRAEEEGPDEDEDEYNEDSCSDSSREPPSSDLNIAAAKQLRQEAAQSLRPAQPSSTGKGKSKAGGSTFLGPPSPVEPMKSFYDKPYLREAALKKTRHGRNVTAFGQPIPDMEEVEFELPEEFASEDVLKAKARERRARNRRSVADSLAAG